MTVSRRLGSAEGFSVVSTSKSRWLYFLFLRFLFHSFYLLFIRGFFMTQGIELIENLYIIEHHNKTQTHGYTHLTKITMDPYNASISIT